MVYEIDQDKVNQQQWDEMKKIAERNVCAVCGADLQVHTNPANATLEVGCLNREHHGYLERASYTALMRRGEAILHPGIQAAIEKKMMPKEDLDRAMTLLALRYPDAIRDRPTAALFISDCMRLDIDPLIQPAEAVPIPFRSRKKGRGGQPDEERTVVSMVVTGDGWLSMCARGCKEEWNGPPRTMRLEEYLTTLPENKKLNREAIAQLAADIKKDACSDPKAWYYVAIGRSKTMTEDCIVPGWFTDRDMKKAVAGNLPAAMEPGNQARIRAIKKWVRQVYPECRQKMIELTHEWYQRAEGVKAAQVYIDTEFRLLDFPAGGEKTGERTGTDKLTETSPGELPTPDQATKLQPAPTVSSPTEGKAAKPKIAPSVPAADLPRNPIFQNWGELAAAAYKLGVTPDQVFKHQHVKRWEDFASYLDAWHVVEFLVTERAERPPLL
ncbi:MAG: hypothetical protein Q8N42_02040 [bacterium]|nr:hypothetical protein [bacterium]